MSIRNINIFEHPEWRIISDKSDQQAGQNSFISLYGSYILDLNILILKMVEFKFVTPGSKRVTPKLALVTYGFKHVIRTLLFKFPCCNSHF